MLNFIHRSQLIVWLNFSSSRLDSFQNKLFACHSSLAQSQSIKLIDEFAMLRHDYLSVCIRRVKCFDSDGFTGIQIILFLILQLLTSPPLIFLGIENCLIRINFIKDVVSFFGLDDHSCSLLVDVEAISPKVLSII